MLRTRLLWFTAGFSVTGALIAHFVWRELCAERHLIASDANQKFHDLQTRVAKLESVALNPDQAPVEG